MTSDDTNEIKNSLFLDGEYRGIGDFLFFILIAIKLSSKFEKIYISWQAVHYYGFFNTFNKILSSSIHCNNIITLPNPIYLNDDRIKIYEKYFSNENNINLSNSNININIYNYENKNRFYYDEILDYLNINCNTFFDNNMRIVLTETEENLNINYYNQLIDHIKSDKYIIVFDCQNRNQCTFATRDYCNDMNPNNYKIIYINKPIYSNNNEYFIGDILNTNLLELFYYHTIIEKAQELHIVNSAQLHYFNLLFNIDKNKYKNVKKYLYPRSSNGVIHKDLLESNTNDINKIYDCNFIKLFNMFELFYPLDYFNEVTKEYNINYVDSNKILPGSGYFNNSGISINSSIKKIQFISIDLINTSFNTITYLNDNELLKLINNIPIKETELNIILIKTDKDYFIKINPRIMDDNNNYTNNTECMNYNCMDPQLIKTINILKKCTNIHYVFPYKNDFDKTKFVNKLDKLDNL